MRRAALEFALTVSALVALTAGTARGDTVEPTRYDLVERAHVVDVRVDRGAARLVVRRTVQNDGPKSDQATFILDLPPSSVATRLRTSTRGPDGALMWFEGELMEAEAAAAKYRELTGMGPFEAHAVDAPL